MSVVAQCEPARSRFILEIEEQGKEPSSIEYGDYNKACDAMGRYVKTADKPARVRIVSVMIEMVMKERS